MSSWSQSSAPATPGAHMASPLMQLLASVDAELAAAILSTAAHRKVPSMTLHAFHKMMTAGGAVVGEQRMQSAFGMDAPTYYSVLSALELHMADALLPRSMSTTPQPSTPSASSAAAASSPATTPSSSTPTPCSPAPAAAARSSPHLFAPVPPSPNSQATIPLSSASSPSSALVTPQPVARVPALASPSAISPIASLRASVAEPVARAPLTAPAASPMPAPAVQPFKAVGTLTSASPTSTASRGGALSVNTESLVRSLSPSRQPTSPTVMASIAPRRLTDQFSRLPFVSSARASPTSVAADAAAPTLPSKAHASGDAAPEAADVVTLQALVAQLRAENAQLRAEKSQMTAHVRAANQRVRWQPMIDAVMSGRYTLDEVEAKFGGEEAASELWQLALVHAQLPENAHEGVWQCVVGVCYDYPRGGVEHDDARAAQCYQSAADRGVAVAQFQLGVWHEIGLCVPKDVMRSVRFFELAADQGHVRAQYLLAQSLRAGRAGVQKNDERAARYYAMAANQGHAQAQFHLGTMYEHGEGVAADDERSAQLFELAAAQGHAPAQRELGFRYSHGLGVVKNEARAAALFESASAQGDVDAIFALGSCFANGLGVATDAVRAAALFQQASDRGLAHAHFALGECYEHGEGVAKDTRRAVELYQRAAYLGEPEAQTALARCLESGRGVERNEARAVEWYALAADQGDAEAQTALALCYELGRGVAVKDVERAIAWYRKAAAQNFQPAIDHLHDERWKWSAMLDEYMAGCLDLAAVELKFGGETAASDLWRMVFKHAQLHSNEAVLQCALGECYFHPRGGAPKDAAQAALWFQRAAERGHALAQHNLGTCYANGTGVVKDEALALQWFQRAAEQGVARAQYNLGYRHEHGKGVARSEQLAAAFYRRAAAQGHAHAARQLKALGC